MRDRTLRHLTALVIGLLLGCGIARAAGGQTPDTAHTVRTPIRIAEVRDSLIRADSIRHAGDSSRAAIYAAADSALKAATILRQRADSLLTSVQDTGAKVQTIWNIRLHSGNGERRATKVYAASILAGLTINYVAGIDRDPGGYHDSWTTFDKWEHANLAYFLTSSAMDQSVPPTWAFALTCGLAGVGWEVSQRGYFSTKDVAADCVGSALAVGFRKLAEKAQR